MRPWCQTRNLNMATALATCGVDFNIERMLDEPTGAQNCWFILSTDSKTMPALSTPAMLKAIREHTLEQSDPSHPVLDCLHGIGIRESLLTWLKRGTRCKLVPLAGTGRCVVEPGSDQSLPNGEMVVTPDMKLAAALMRCGFPCAAIEPAPGGGVQFLIRETGHFPGKASEVAAGIRNGTLAAADPSHPSLWVLMALKNRASILGMLRRNEELVLLRNPRSEAWKRYSRSAVIFTNSTPKALDKVREHLRV